MVRRNTHARTHSERKSITTRAGGKRRSKRYGGERRGNIRRNERERKGKEKIAEKRTSEFNVGLHDGHATTIRGHARGRAGTHARTHARTTGCPAPQRTTMTLHPSRPRATEARAALTLSTSRSLVDSRPPPRAREERDPCERGRERREDGAQHSAQHTHTTRFTRRLKTRTDINKAD